MSVREIPLRENDRENAHDRDPPNREDENEMREGSNVKMHPREDRPRQKPEESWKKILQD